MICVEIGQASDASMVMRDKVKIHQPFYYKQKENWRFHKKVHFRVGNGLVQAKFFANLPIGTNPRPFFTAD